MTFGEKLEEWWNGLSIPQIFGLFGCIAFLIFLIWIWCNPDAFDDKMETLGHGVWKGFLSAFGLLAIGYLLYLAVYGKKDLHNKIFKKGGGGGGGAHPHP